MPSYSDEFKADCLKRLELLKELGTLNFEGVQIKNVRELVKFLGISSYTIYKWLKEAIYNGTEKDIQDEVKKEIATNRTDFIESFTEDETFINDLEVLGFEGDGDFFSDSEESKRIPYENGIFNGRFYAWLGAGLNVPYASKNHMNTNMLKIGLELIKRSELVDCDKIKKAMRVN